MTFFLYRFTAWYPKISKFLRSKSMMSQLSNALSNVLIALLDQKLSHFEVQKYYCYSSQLLHKKCTNITWFQTDVTSFVEDVWRSEIAKRICFIRIIQWKNFQVWVLTKNSSIFISLHGLLHDPFSKSYELAKLMVELTLLSCCAFFLIVCTL